MVEGRPGATVLEQVDQPDIINDIKHYGMHRHFTDGCSILMFGGGIKKGYAYGKTADERPCKSIEKPIRIAQLHQTVYHALGIPEDTHYVIEKRPFFTTPDGNGKAEMELFAWLNIMTGVASSSTIAIYQLNLKMMFEMI